MNIRLYPDQVERLKSGKYSGVAVLRYAYKRYCRGDFGRIVVQNNGKKKDRENVPHLESFTIRQRFPVSDALLREILRKHWEIPDKVLAAEKARAEAEVEELFLAYTGKEYILIEEKEK